MQTRVMQINWESYLRNKLGSNIQPVDSYVFFSEDMDLLPAYSTPFAIDAAISIICTRGKAQITIGYKSYEAVAPCLINLSAGEVLQYQYISDDFRGQILFLSKTLINDLFINIKERLSLSLSTRIEPVISLDEKELEFNETHYKLLKNTVKEKRNIHIKKIILHSLLSLYFQQHDNLDLFSLAIEQFSKHEEILIRFFDLVNENYKQERQVGFYADQLHFTPKYLSQLIKSNTGKSVNDWINDLVMLEAKSLLVNSILTIQQISEILNFNDQSTFSKYFKQHEGVTPKEYRSLNASSL